MMDCQDQETSTMVFQNSNFCTHLTLGRCHCLTIRTTTPHTNTINVCTHLTLGVCSCITTKTHVYVSSSSLSSSSSTKKRKLCHNDQVDARKKRGTDIERSDDDHWKIKKVLEKSDVSNMSRLMLSKELVEKYVLPMLGDEDMINGKGIGVKILDLDTSTMHSLVFKRWVSSKCYIFIGKWIQDFVKRRNLKKGDEIGLNWDPNNNHFNFSVLSVN